MLTKIPKIKKADLWVFDNDGTLYDSRLIEPTLNNVIIEFIAGIYKISKEKAQEKRKELLLKHQTSFTLVALKGEGVNGTDFISKTFLSVNPAEFGIVEDVRLKNILSHLTGEKMILTNNPSAYARKILKALGVEDFFSHVVGVEEQNFVLKPDVEAFGFLVKRIKNGDRIMFVDDDEKNIMTARKIGCETVWANNF